MEKSKDYRPLRKYYRAKYFAETQALNYPKESNDKSAAKTVQITIVNLCIDGVGILSREKLETGSIMTFVLYLGGIGHEIMAYITFCKKMGEMYRAGLKLISPENIFTSALLDYIENEKHL